MSAAQGKYDIYGLFFERALRLLHKNGEFALITQSTFLEKEWAEGLRGLLSTEATLRWIVDLGPFGQLFFNAMNAPCITVATKTLPNGDEQVGAIVSRNPKFPVSERARRQQFVADQIERVVSALDHGQAIPDGFATGSFIDQRQLKETISSRWNLQRSSADAVLLQPHFAASDLLEVRQGVTPGGCLDLFLMSKAGAERLELEEVLVHKAIKSKQIKRWFVDWSELVLLYPYRKAGREWIPAFGIDTNKVKNKATVRLVESARLKDALDFDTQLDEREREIVRRSGVNQASVVQLLSHRVGLGLVSFPKTAAYLIQHYDLLEGRIFKQKNIRKFARQWYEYLWPRDPEVLFAPVRILAPTLLRKSRFVLDESRFLSDHACLYLQPTKKTKRGWDDFGQRMEATLSKRPTKREMLLDCLAFLNSSTGTRALTEGRQPTPKGSYQVTEKSLSEVPIPFPSDKKQVGAIIAKTAELVDAKDVLDAARLEGREKELEKLTRAMAEQAAD